MFHMSYNKSSFTRMQTKYYVDEDEREAYTISFADITYFLYKIINNKI